MSERVVIIGNSHAAVSVIETLRREGFQGKLTLISEGKIPPYSPTALPYLLWEKEKERKPLRPTQFYKGIDIIETKAVSIEPEKSEIFLLNQRKIHYDRLVIATGASPARLSFDGSAESLFLTLRKRADLEEIEKRARNGTNILIVGAGLIGLHLAQELQKKHKRIHVIELKEQILPGLVHPELALFLKGLFEQKGIRISLGANLFKVRGSKALLSNGEEMDYDLILTAIGIRPNLEITMGTSIVVREGVLVNEQMETNIPGIYACGDVAEYRDFFTGESRLNPNVVNASEQGRIVGESLTGKKSFHPGLITVNTFNCFGSNLFSLGRFIPGPGDRVFEECDQGKSFFKRIVFTGDRLKGMILFNTPVDGGIYYRLMREKVSLRGWEEKILEDPYLWGKLIIKRFLKS